VVNISFFQDFDFLLRRETDFFGQKMHFFEQERDFLERDYWGYLPARQQPTHLRSLVA